MFNSLSKIFHKDANFFEMFGELVAELAQESDHPKWEVREFLIKGFDERAALIDEKYSGTIS